MPTEPCPSADPARLASAAVADLAVAAPGVGPRGWHLEADFLLRQWSEPARRYHTLQHLAEVLAALQELAGHGACAPDGLTAARLGAWYHDVVYDPRAGAGSNEHRSAAVARDRLHRLGAPDALVEEVEALVLLTLDHAGSVTGGTGPAAVLHDADLWVLAAPPTRFDEYCRQVRQEYAHVPADSYARARAQVLRQLVAGPVYRTRHAERAWEDAARANVARELSRLTGTAGR